MGGPVMVMLIAVRARLQARRGEGGRRAASGRLSGGESEGGIRRMKWGGEFGATEWLFWAELGI